MEFIRADRLHKRFRGVRAVADVSFGADEQEVLGIIGPNGAGKTTVFNLIAGVFRPDSGTLTFAGRDVTELPSYRRLRCGISRTFQLIHPFGSLTARDNLIVSATGSGMALRQARARADEVLGVFGLAEVAKRPAGSLNAAEGKRLEVARAVAARPRVILLDEVFTGLVAREVAELAGLVAGLRDAGMTILVIEHSVTAIRMVADRVVAMDAGRVICEGDPGSVFSDANVVESYLGHRAAT